MMTSGMLPTLTDYPERRLTELEDENALLRGRMHGLVEVLRAVKPGLTNHWSGGARKGLEMEFEIVSEALRANR